MKNRIIAHCLLLLVTGVVLTGCRKQQAPTSRPTAPVPGGPVQSGPAPASPSPN